jgi:hypothetical protein
MQWSDLPLNPSKRMLRQFAALWLAVFAGLAAWHAQVDERVTIAGVFAILAVTIGPLGLIAPVLIRPVFVAWTVLAFPIGWTVSRLVLLLLFGAIVTPLALIFRLRGRDPLQIERRSDATTYWVRKPAPPDLASYFRQS